MSLQIIYLICIIFLNSALTIPIDTYNGCSIDINKDLTYQHPLILDTIKNEFILPNIKNGISFSSGGKIRLVCPGQNNHLQINTAKEVIITCVANKTFSLNNFNYEFKQLRCYGYPEPIAKRTGNSCYKGKTQVQIGFETNKGFVSIMTNCFDNIKKDVLYSKYELSSKIGNSQYAVPRPDQFKEGDFYNDMYPKPTVLYDKRSQRTALERILKSSALAEKYIQFNTDFFLSRGHFTAKADFIYGSQQRATFFYVNVAPQWYTFNSNNWNEVEISVRKFAKTRNLDLIVYTGIYGISQLPDINNNYQNLTLYVTNSKQLITIPELYWKVLHEPITNRAIALIGHNNPYDKNVAKKAICNDVSSRINWLSWDAKNITSGFSYSCEVTEFKKIVDYMPDIPISGLLV